MTTETVVTLGAERRRAPAGYLLGFFALTFLVTWTCWFAVMAWSRNFPPGRSLGPGLGGVLLLGTFAPSLVALALTARGAGREGVVALLGRVFGVPVSARWYLFAATYMAAIKLAVALVHRLLTGSWPPFGHEPWYLMVVAIPISTLVQAGEEIGWRGFALPRLAVRFGLARSSLLLGVIWAGWHLPLFFLRATDTYGQSFPVYLLQVTALSVAITWLYWRTGGSLLPVMLMHAAINNTKDIVPSMVTHATNPLAPSTSLVAWLTLALLWVSAGFFLMRMRHADPAVLDARST